MPPILYMTPLSPPSRAVLITGKMLSLELELEEVDLSKGEHRKLDYLKLNPLHAVPTLVDGDLTIIDSHAINAYLASKYGTVDSPLYPKELGKRAMVDQRLYFDTGILFNLFRNAAGPLFYRKSKTVAPEQEDRIVESYGFVEKFLEQSDWMAGDHVTIADFSVFTSVTALDVLVSLDGDRFPKVRAWIDKCQELECTEVSRAGLESLRKVVKLCME